MRRRSPIDGDGVLLTGGLLALDAVAIAVFWLGPLHQASTFVACSAGVLAGLVAIFVAAGVALRSVRRRRFGPAPTNLTRNDVLGVVFASVLGIDALVILALRGVRPDLATLILGALAAGGLGRVLWVTYRLVTSARPLRARPDLQEGRGLLDTNHEFPPYDS
jgi:hypothetical protein